MKINYQVKQNTTINKSVDVEDPNFICVQHYVDGIERYTAFIGKRGGDRTGSGRPLKYGEPTKTFRKKVPISKIGYIEEVVSKELEVFLVGGKSKNKI